MLLRWSTGTLSAFELDLLIIPAYSLHPGLGYVQAFSPPKQHTYSSTAKPFSLPHCSHPSIEPLHNRTHEKSTSPVAPSATDHRPRLPTRLVNHEVVRFSTPYNTQRYD